MDALTRPITNGAAVTPDDSNDLAYVTRGIYVGTAGNLKVTLLNGDAITFTSLAAGIIHPIRAKRIWTTGTTAANILGLY